MPLQPGEQNNYEGEIEQGFTGDEEIEVDDEFIDQIVQILVDAANVTRDQFNTTYETLGVAFPARRPPIRRSSPLRRRRIRRRRSGVHAG